MLPPGENIAETKKCRLSGQEFIVTDKDMEFYDKVSPVFGGQKYAIPSPTLCPDERLRRRMMYRNEITLYKRTCDFNGSSIISLHNSTYTGPVYNVKTWWGDEWNPLDYGIDFDFSKPFFEQFKTLSRSLPHPAAVNDTGLASENCEYTNDCWYAKDCYLVSCAWRMRECYYCHKTLADLENCMDCEGPLTQSQHCYGCIVGSKLSHCFFLTNCHNCTDCTLGINLIGCKNCYGCSNLANKEYYFFNEALTKVAYSETIKNIPISEGKKKFEALLPDIYYKENCNINCENCRGEYLAHCKNCYECFEAFKAVDCRYYQTADTVTNCHDVLISGLCQWNYENLTCDEGGMTCFSIYSSKCRDTLYSELCHSSENLFGCVALRKHQKNGIFNKLYSKNEYEMLCTKIIDHMRSTGEWGEFFPHQSSPYAYNETIAQEYFPISKEVALNVPNFEERRFREPPSGRGNGTIEGTKGDLLGINPPSSQSSATPSEIHSLLPFKKEVAGKGWGWYEEPLADNSIKPISALPIKEYDEKRVGFETAQKNIDALLSGILQCSESHKFYKILPKELAFYIEHLLPIPTKHPEVRRLDRIHKKNGRKLFQRSCFECGKNITTTYVSDKPQKVLCESCYRNHVY